MRSLNSQQKNHLQGFKSVVGSSAPERVLVELLNKHKWDPNAAIEEYFSTGLSDKYIGGSVAAISSAGAKISESNVKKLFGKYTQPKVDKIEGEGIEKFYTDLKVDMEDPVTLLVSYLMGAKSQGVYTYEEFNKGCQQAGVDTLEGWFKVLPELRKQLDMDPSLFEKVYNFTFDFT